MSIGKMNAFIDIIETQTIKDKAGFTTTNVKVVASVRTYMEQRSGIVRWANMAAFSTANVMFCFRVIPSLEITTRHEVVYDKERFEIKNVENIKGRNMYIEVLCEGIKDSG